MLKNEKIKGIFEAIGILVASAVLSTGTVLLTTNYVCNATWENLINSFAVSILTGISVSLIFLILNQYQDKKRLVNEIIYDTYVFAMKFDALFINGGVMVPSKAQLDLIEDFDLQFKSLIKSSNKDTSWVTVSQYIADKKSEIKMASNGSISIDLRPFTEGLIHKVDDMAT